MSARYALGTVAVATVRGVPNVRVMAGEGSAEPKLRWVTTDNRVYAAGDPHDDMWFFAFQVTDVRPLVVLDPEDGMAIARLLDSARANLASRGTGEDIIDRIVANTDAMQAALREFANPKPVEPIGLGAVVEDAACARWTRARNQEHGLNWRAEWGGQWKPFADIDAVRVLSEGVIQ